MKRITDKEFDEAKGCLKRFSYNKLNIITIRLDLMTLTGINYDNTKLNTNKINDVVGDSVIKIDENAILQKSIREYKAVEMAKKLIDEDSLYILDHLYDKRDMRKWEIINNGMSESTYYRKNKLLILAVANALKKI